MRRSAATSRSDGAGDDYRGGSSRRDGVQAAAQRAACTDARRADPGGPATSGCPARRGSRLSSPCRGADREVAVPLARCARALAWLTSINASGRARRGSSSAAGRPLARTLAPVSLATRGGVGQRLASRIGTALEHARPPAVSSDERDAFTRLNRVSSVEPERGTAAGKWTNIHRCPVCGHVSRPGGVFRSRTMLRRPPRRRPVTGVLTWEGSRPPRTAAFRATRTRPAGSSVARAAVGRSRHPASRGLPRSG